MNYLEDYELTEKCPKCGNLCDTYSDEENRVEKSCCCGVWVWGDCEACQGEGLVDEAEYENDWINYPSHNFVQCPECKGSGREYSPFTPKDWEKS